MSSIFNSKAKLTVLVAGLLLVAAAALYHQLLTGSYHFSGPDSLSPKAVGTGLRALEAESGEMPTWMPWVFSGLPTVHSFTSVSALYMPYLITKPLVGLGMPGFWVFLLHLIFGGLGTYVLVRRLGGTFAAGLLSGSGFMLMPYTNTMIVHGHGSQMMTLVYLPWVIWALVRLYEDRNLISTAWLTLLVGLMLQRGHVQIAYYALMLAGLMALVMIVRLYRDADRGMTEAGKFTGTFALAMLLAFSLAAALFIPAMEYTPYSIRGAQAGGGVGFDYATQWSFSLGESLTFIAPSFYGFGGVTYWGNMPFTDYPNYMGLLLLGLAIWAVYRRRDWLTLTLASASIIAFLVSLGHNFFLYRLLYNILPFFNKFRVPVMILVIPQFSVAVLAGLGLDDLLKYMEARKPDEVRQFIIRLSIGVLGGGILLMVASAMLAGNFPPSRGVPGNMVEYVNYLRLGMIRLDALLFIAILGVSTGLLYLWRMGTINRNVLLSGLLTISAVDLARIDWQIIYPSRGSLRSSVLISTSSQKRYLGNDQVTDYLVGQQRPYRIWPVGPLQKQNRWAAFQIESIAGYHPAKLANYNRMMNTTGFRSGGILQMLNVKYLVSMGRFEDPRFEEVFVGTLYQGDQYKPAVVYHFKDALERAWFPADVRHVTGPDQALAAIMAPQYDPVQVVYLAGASSTVRPVAGFGRVLEADWRPAHIRLQVETGSSALLVVSEVYYPGGWVARVDGEETPIHEVNTVLRGVQVPQGRHEVTLDFEPRDLALGRWISNLALLVVLLGFMPSTVRRIRLLK